MTHVIAFPKFNPAGLKRRGLWLGLGAAAGLASLALAAVPDLAPQLAQWARLAPWPARGGALVIFGLRLADVPIGTLKTVLMVRGWRAWATLLGLLEVTIWLTAMGRVMGQLDNPWNIAGYALGYTAGTWLGMWLESRLAFGTVEIHTISLARSGEVAAALRAAGHGVTQFQGYGQSGPVCIVGTVAERKHLAGLLKTIRNVDPDAFVTGDETRQVVGGFRPGK